MDIDKQAKKSTFYNVKGPNEPDLTNITILSTPRPQASSTVQQKSLYQNIFHNEGRGKKKLDLQLNDSDFIQQSEESSLGLLDNISSLLGNENELNDLSEFNSNTLDANLEFAKKILDECSKQRTSSKSNDKDNDTNTQHFIYKSTTSTPESGFKDSQYDTQDDTLKASLVFEPQEITARSSGLSGSSETCFDFSEEKTGSITIDAATAELMAEFDKEEFQSASEIIKQLTEEEFGNNPSISLTESGIGNRTKDHEYLNLSGFSGIIGDFDISLDSHAGRKISIEEYFRRKCGNIGALSDETNNRPSIGFSSVRSPERSTIVPLVDSTVSSEVTSLDKEMSQLLPSNPDATKSSNAYSIMSLSTIAQALQNVENATPKKLVDQLIMAKKKRKQLEMPIQNVSSLTYTIDRKSMPLTPNTEIPERDFGFHDFSAKFSLDSKTLSEAIDKFNVPCSPSIGKDGCYDENESMQNNLQHQMLYRTDNFEDLTALNQRESREYKPMTQKMMVYSPSCNENIDLLSRLSKDTCGKNLLSGLNNQSKELGMEHRENIKKENISYRSRIDDSDSLELSNSKSGSQQCGDIICANYEELCICLVGVPRDIEITLVNKSEKWLLCSMNLHALKEEENNVAISLPSDVILLKPNANQTKMIKVKILNECKPFIVTINVKASDMVTRSQWNIRPRICFAPECPKVEIITESGNQELDFHQVALNSSKALPLTIKNQNKIDLRLKISIIQGYPQVFAIRSAHTDFKEVEYIDLQYLEQFTINIQLKSKISSEDNQFPISAKGKVIIEIENEDGYSIIVNEISLVAQIDVCKLEIVDTVLPLVIPKKQSKPLHVMNIGRNSVSISGNVIKHPSRASEELEDDTKYFSVNPDNLFINAKSKGTFIVSYKPSSSDNIERKAALQLSALNYVSYVSLIGEKHVENYEYSLRCETPEIPISNSSSTSPHSLMSMKSGISGRHSPIGSVSGMTVSGIGLPIRTTHASLVWNSVRAGKSETKEFTIKNISNNKIKILASIYDTDKSFKFLKERQSVCSSIVIGLQCMESRTLAIVFNPHHVGASAGKITFKHYESKHETSEHRQSKAIYLYGYGGNGRIEISEINKDTSGKMWLSLGSLTPAGPLRAKIKIKNTGDLRAYAKIQLVPKAVYPGMASSWGVNPTELLLDPRGTEYIILNFQPRKEDLKRLQKCDVSHVGTLNVTYGDEPTRWRIRRLYKKVMSMGELEGKENLQFRNIVQPICTVFPGEQIISDLNIIRDTIQNLGDLCHGVRQHEIMLTVEMHADETLSLLHDDVDESQMYYSLYSDTSHIHDTGGDSFLPSTSDYENENSTPSIYDDYFTVHPQVVYLTPPFTNEAIIMISSSRQVAQAFETALQSHSDSICIIPTEGMIPTGKHFPLKIQCKKTVGRNFECILQIFTENDKQDVLIRVVIHK